VEGALARAIENVRQSESRGSGTLAFFVHCYLERLGAAAHEKGRNELNQDKWKQRCGQDASRLQGPPEEQFD
jgi:hypothetical protein